MHSSESAELTNLIRKYMERWQGELTKGEINLLQSAYQVASKYWIEANQQKIALRNELSELIEAHLKTK